MPMPTYELAQLNLAKIKHPTADAPEMEDFYAAIESVNQEAENHPGFVWRWVEQDAPMDPVRIFGDPLMVVNMSVWESVEALKDFVYSGKHLGVYKRKKEWFRSMAENHMVLWWVPQGHRPTLEEAKERLLKLQKEGPQHAAFTFGQQFSPEFDQV